MTVALSADNARTLCEAAGLNVIGVQVGAARTWVSVAALRVTPETAIKRLYAAGCYAVEYGWQFGDGEIFVLAAKGE